MSGIRKGDKVRINTPSDWPAVSKFKLAGAEGTVDSWIDWPELMDSYGEYHFVIINKAAGDAAVYEGAKLIFHNNDLEKL